MRLDTVSREVSSSGTMQVSKATIKATPKLFDMFADQTYGNKPVAITRELVSNAIDAHVAAGKGNIPIEVYLPTELDPVFSVKDNGTGMSHDFVMNDFMAYTNGSTKDQTDTQIGGFGIGSKSPFAYVDQFTLRVIYEGVVSVYTMFKDTDGIPAIGLQAQSTTDEANGVEVSFPVESGDVQTFRDAAQEALQYFQPVPIVHNGQITPPNYTYVGTGWALRPQGGELGVIVGGVRYPVTAASLTYELRTNTDLGPLLQYGLDLTVPIGSVGIAMSREALSYTPKTSASIEAALRAVVKDVISTFATIFDDQPSVWAAQKMLFEQTGGTNRHSQNARQQLLGANAQYKGVKLETTRDVKTVKDAKAWMVPGRHTYGRKRSLKKPSWEQLDQMRILQPGNIETVIIDDLPQSPKSKTTLKLAAFLEAAPRAKDILILRVFPDNTKAGEIQRLRRELGEPQDIVYTSQLPEPPAKVKSLVQSDGTVRPKVRMFQWDGRKDSSGYGSARTITNLTPANGKGVREIAVKDQPTTGIMVVMNNFDLPPKFQEMIESELIPVASLVFVNSSDAPHLAKTFKNFVDIYPKKLEAKLKSFTGLAEKMAVAYDSELSDIFGDIAKLTKVAGSLKLSPAASKRPFGKIVNLYQTYVVPMTAEERKFGKLVTPVLPKGLNTKKLVANFARTQPEAKLLLDLITDKWSFTKAHVDLLIKNV